MSTASEEVVAVPPSPGRPKVGAAYNVFDGEELLEASIRSIRDVVDFVVVVYQVVSNFGMPASESLVPRLEALQAAGLVDELVRYDKREFTAADRARLVSPRASSADLGGARPAEVADQFFHELSKRELGRQRCLAAGCSWFMSLDTDECYRAESLRSALRTMIEGDYDIGLCKMRYFYKDPRWELLPRDERNWVCALYRCIPAMEFRLGCPFPLALLVDPTRKLHWATRLRTFERSELEMFHFSFVRDDIRSKILNVSNRGNYSGATPLPEFLVKFPTWTPETSGPILHPHPYFHATFRRVRVVANEFGIRVAGMDAHPDLPEGAEFERGKRVKALPDSDREKDGEEGEEEARGGRPAGGGGRVRD